MMGFLSLSSINKLNINFIRIVSFAYIFSILMIVISLGSIFYNKFNLGIDFTGGTLLDIKVSSNTKIDFSHLEDGLKKFTGAEVIVQAVKNSNNLMIKIGTAEELKDEAQTAKIQSLQNEVQKLINPEIVFERVEFVGPQIGGEIIKGGILSVLLAFVAILLYIAFRFKLIFGVSILLSLVHDSIITFGFISLSGLEFNSTSIAAILTVIGYSVNDTVVIFDRIRENMHKYRRMALAELINISINETLSRTINTVLTTLLAIGALIIFAGENLFSFSATTFFGIVIGTYSSIFISAPILILLSKNKSS